MPRILVSFLVSMALLAAPAPALELRRVAELRLGSGGFVEWLDPRGFLRMTNEWERTPSGGRKVTFVVADVRARELLRLPFDLEGFARAHPGLFTGAPGVELAHFDGTMGLLRFDRREPTRTTSHYVTWDPRTQRTSEPVPIGETILQQVAGKTQVRRLTWLVGPDPAGGRLYFADVTYDDRPSPAQGPLAFRLFRVTLPDLRPDGEVELPLPRRERPLRAESYRAFSPDGRRLAIAEYDDAAGQRESRAVPPAQVYVVDLERWSVAAYSIPRTPYGLAFSRDGRHLAVGSHEEGVILRIDLESGRVDRRVKAQPHIQAFAVPSSGATFLSMPDHIGAPRSIEVRRWSDLGLQETIAPSRLFPGVAGIHASGVSATADGRYLVAPAYAPDGYPDSKDRGLVIFEFTEGASPSAPDPTALVRPHVERSRMRLYAYQLGRVGAGDGYFAPIAASSKGEALAVGTRSHLPEDAPWRPGSSQAHAVWVDAAGRLVLERSLHLGKGCVDEEGGSAVATADGAFLAFVLCYPAPGAGASTRVLKLDRSGKVLWQWTSAFGRNARFAEDLRLLPGGTVLMTGHVGTSTTPWVGELDAATGRLLRDEVGAAR